MNYSIFNNYDALKDILKPVVCKTCSDDGKWAGDCPACLKNRAWNREYLETHPFVADTNLEGYHTSYHDDFKGLVLRLPNEHPYLYYGIEVEVEFDRDIVSVQGYDDDGYEDGISDEINSILAEAIKRCPIFVAEQDGSLENGAELISRPCSYAFWTDKNTVKMLEDMFEYLKEQGALVHQPSTNGLHIHISRKFFDKGAIRLASAGQAYQEFDWLWQKFQPEMEQLGGRKYTQYCESKADKLAKGLRRSYLPSSLCPTEVKVSCKLKKGGEIACGDHSHAVLLSGNTIEVRTFKSTTDYRKILSCIEIVRNFAHAVRDNNTDTTLDSLLHTKDNLFLNEHIQKVRMNCKKNKQEFNLDKKNSNDIKVDVKVNS